MCRSERNVGFYAFGLASPEANWLFWFDSDDGVVAGSDLHELAEPAPDEVDALYALYESAHDNERPSLMPRAEELHSFGRD